MSDLSISPPGRGRLRPGAALLIPAALAALLLTGWRYITPLSGITGTAGALLAMFGAFMLIIAGVLLLRLPRGGWRGLFLILSWLGVILTLIAELFLHGWMSAAALGVGAVGLAIESFSAAPVRRVLP